jgi:HTH-type transcriptional regulator/antitoxin HigA
MPTATYEQLLAETLPARIESDEHYRQHGERLGNLIGKGRARSADETKDYDRRNAIPPDDSTAAELLQFLVEHSGKTTADLIPVFGQRSHVNEAVNGRRLISADQARKLGKVFGVSPGLFVR